MAATYQQQSIAAAQQQPLVVQNVYPVQQQIAEAAQQPYSTTAATDSPRYRYIKVIRGLGISECILGGLSVLLAVVANAIVLRELGNYRLDLYDHDDSYNPDIQSDYEQLYYRSSDHYLYQAATTNTGLTYASQGIWSGILVITTGIFGMRIMNTPSRGMYINNMAIAFITVLISSPGCVISGLAAAFSTFSVTMVALHSVITILISISVIITITHSAFCCSGVCNSSSSVSTQRLVYYPQQNLAQPQPQYLRGPNGQFMMVFNQPITPQIIQHVPQTLTVRQAPAIVNPVTTPMPPTSAQNLDGTYESASENAPENAPPPYPPVI